MEYNILPYPKEIVECEGFFITDNRSMAINGEIDRRIIRKAIEIKALLEKCDMTKHKFFAYSESEADITVEVKAHLNPDEYTLDISENVIRLCGGDAAGCFYGLQTFKQLILLYGNKIPSLKVHDYPDMKYRGFYHDATRGRVPSIDGMKKIIDELASLKINSLQLYVEHSFDFYEFNCLDRTDEDYLTPEDIIAIDDYCYENFIDFIPSLSTFGHLYELLCLDKYKELCELENYCPNDHFWRERMAHHTINPSDPRSFEVICSMIDQYLPLFRSEYFNICCDETMDLCMGKNKGKDRGRLYCDFVNKIIGYVTGKGKKVMMWGDIALEHPEALQKIPKSTIFLNWDYSANPHVKNIDIIKESGFTQIVCPGTTSWTRLIEDPITAVPNITCMIEYGFKKNVIGVLNTNWGDYGHPASFENALYGMAVAACMSWNINTDIDDKFEIAVSNTIYGTEIDMVSCIKELSKAQETASWLEFFEWNKTHNKSCFSSDAETAEASMCKCEKIIKTLSEVKGNCSLISHVIVAAEGIALLNSAKVIILKNKDFSEWKVRVNLWFPKYEKLWLEGNKPSELNEIKKFIEKISS